ncbi:MAG: PfkB family carbohydrate kinase [Endomicrobiaceae bacterium]|nr:PfkB family carbohydrate kinase [Endomicrobiaceae bacterium]
MEIIFNSSIHLFFNHVNIFFISGNGQDLDILKKWSMEYNTIFTATLGQYGSVSYKNGKKYLCKAIKPKKVIDTTGCGDSYQAGFIMEYLSSKNIKKSMIKGSESAAKTLSFIGGFKI